MAKEVQAVAEETGLIAQAQAEYEAIRAQIAEHYQQARELRNQADKLNQSGRTDVQVMTEVNQLLDQAKRLTSLADQLDDHERLEAIRNMNELEIEACVLKEKRAYNENMLARQHTELEKVKEEAAAMIRRAEEEMKETSRCLAVQKKRLAELEG
ncbi:hypothetical protein ABE237_08130 [Brevibacillus formosus]|uniref:Uncharacterized protein n=1 Tax=Paenibacillus alvei TaxID=44250 RepID=A0A383RB49_PAEAL|nr:MULTISPECIES: hypothetical protein [Paenibacillaceae]MBG9943540.1 hypothetical protein [Brevibacillus formosus]MED1948084.1 hypothetical protein [Brevibacillus formosus]MED1998185.1 hypothetical protein [Brevibacillus formosus]MED2080726.1 hypothetical protein [Brevibacillus formosus]PSK20602.1 hypothetical protein C7R94_04210 [Brevibacillus sp. NRRL NRS-603]